MLYFCAPPAVSEGGAALPAPPRAGGNQRAARARCAPRAARGGVRKSPASVSCVKGPMASPAAPPKIFFFFFFFFLGGGGGAGDLLLN